MDKFTSHTGVGVPLRRSNVDTDQIIPAVYLKRVTRSGLRGRPVLRLAQRPDVRAQQRGVRRGVGARGRARLRHRLVARARRLGAAELRLQGRHLARASATSSGATPARPGCSPPRSTRRSCSGSGTTSTRPPAPPSRSTSSRAPCAPARASTRSRTPSTSTTTRAGACSRASTTSASRWATRTTSRLRGQSAELEAGHAARRLSSLLTTSDCRESPVTMGDSRQFGISASHLDRARSSVASWTPHKKNGRELGRADCDERHDSLACIEGCRARARRHQFIGREDSEQVRVHRRTLGTLRGQPKAAAHALEPCSTRSRARSRRARRSRSPASARSRSACVRPERSATRRPARTIGRRRRRSRSSPPAPTCATSSRAPRSCPS